MEILFFVIFVIFFFAILIALVLGNTIPIYKNHNKVTGDIINYDSFMRKFVYKVHLSRVDIINLLKTAKDTDALVCTFDSEKSIIKFSEYGSHREYFFQVQEYDGFSILRFRAGCVDRYAKLCSVQTKSIFSQ